MHLHVLGSHNSESKTTIMESHVIDGVIALDAGSLTRGLSFDEIRNLRAILFTHRHYDHVRDLYGFAQIMRDEGVTVDVYAIEDTAEFIKARVIDGKYNRDYFSVPNFDNPVLKLHIVEPFVEFDVLDKYKAIAIPVPHAVPAVGYQIDSGSTKLFYTGDTGKGLADMWEHVSPDVLLSEVTYGNDSAAHADEVGHLTPDYLKMVLERFRDVHGFLPKVITSHFNPPHEKKVHAELRDLAEQMGHEITISHAGMKVDL